MVVLARLSLSLPLTYDATPLDPDRLQQKTQREVRIFRGLTRCRYWKFSEHRWQSTLHCNPSPPQLDTSDDSRTAVSISRQYGTPFAASTSTSLSKHIQPARSEAAGVQRLVIHSLWDNLLSTLCTACPLAEIRYCMSTQLCLYCMHMEVWLGNIGSWLKYMTALTSGCKLKGSSLVL